VSDLNLVPLDAPAMELRHFAGDEGQRRMVALANELRSMIADRARRGRPWTVRMGNSEHVKIEGWQYAGQRAGITAHVVETRDIRHPKTGDYEGVTAIVEARLVQNGQAISRAECDCYADEIQRKKDGELHARWLDPAGKPNRQAIKGMAQTRASSRALSGALRFLMELAGYAGTPAEEMDGVDAQNPSKPPIRPPQATQPAGAEQYVDGQIEELDKKEGETNGNAWVRFTVRIGGQLYSTFDTKVGEFAMACCANDTVVRAFYEVKGRYRNLVDIQAAPGQDIPL